MRRTDFLLKPKEWFSGANLLLFFTIAFAAPGCLKNVDNTASGPKARLSVSNFVVNASGVDVLLDDNRVTDSAIGFGSTTGSGGSSYLQVGAGLHNIKLRSGTEVIADYTISLGASANYSLFMYDSLRSSGVSVLLTANEPDTLAKARFLHFIPGNDTLTALISRDTVAVAVVKAYTGKQSDPEGNSSFAIALSPGTYRLQLIRKNTVIFSIDAVQVQAGKQYSFAAIGRSGGTGVYAERMVVIEHSY